MDSLRKLSRDDEKRAGRNAEQSHTRDGGHDGDTGLPDVSEEGAPQ